MRVRDLLVSIGAAMLLGEGVWAGPTHLVRHPSSSEQHVVFAYANDIWIVDRSGADGHDARRLTTSMGNELDPHLSPDGTMVAFTAQYDGNTDVYVLPIEGGSPRRLTWHPGNDTVIGWTPDGSRVMFTSGRDTAPVPYGRFWTIGLDDSMPRPMPVPRGHTGKLDPSGRWLVYQPIVANDVEWRNYRGGQCKPIWLLDLETLDLRKLPWTDSRDTDPVWLDGAIYFLSDRDHTMNIYRYEPNNGAMRQVTFHTEYDAKTLEAGGGVLVYEHAGLIWEYDPQTDSTRALDIEVKGDFPHKRPRWESVAGQLQNGRLSPKGKRAVFEARGEIITVPVEHGDWRNLTKSSGVADRAPAWSPDGEHIAWFSDASGEYRLMIATQDNLEDARALDMMAPGFFYGPVWSPDSSHLVFTDENRRLHLWNVEAGEAVGMIDGDTRCVPERSLNPVWSPCSKWLAYSKRLDSHLRAIMVYSLETGEIHQVTDGLSDAVNPVFDPSGKYLYFMASTDTALRTGWLDMTGYDNTMTRGLYVAVLQNDVPSPFVPRSDEEDVPEEPAGDGDDESAEDTPDAGDATPEEGADAATEDAGKPDEDATRIDFEGLDQRILAVPVPQRNYASLAAIDGAILYSEASYDLGAGGLTLHKYSMTDREASVMMQGIGTFTVSADGQKLMYGGGGTWGVVSTMAPAAPGQGALATGGIRVRIDPPAEWRQMFDEAWRLHRDFFYVENMHGADWEAIYPRYARMVKDVSHRADLTYLIDVTAGELAVGHSFTFGGDTPSVDGVSIGLLGADVESNQGRYRIARILRGENWNPGLQAPLNQPGLDVSEGDYIISVDGADLTDAANFYSAFEGTAGRQVTLEVSDSPDGSDSRRVTVVPIGSEFMLRQRDWMEHNRQRVEELSDGKLAYVWLPDTANGGFTNFNRYFFAQQDRAGAVIDERFNGGGSAADYIVDVMNRKHYGYFNNPIGERQPWRLPQAGLWGPKVMIINDAAGSGGDLLPYLFRAMEIGPLIGTRTWGGLVGIWDFPFLIDGGGVTIPRGGFFDLDGVWDVENVGVAPDIEVEITPRDFMNGRDAQLERAVAEAMRLLEQGGYDLLDEPAPPVRARHAK